MHMQLLHLFEQTEVSDFINKKVLVVNNNYEKFSLDAFFSLAKSWIITSSF